MHWSWSTTVEPVAEPLSLSDAKDHLRITDSVEDDLVTAYIVAARKWVENYTGRSIAEQTIRFNLDEFPHTYQSILLPQSPVRAITSVQYVDTDGATQTLAGSEYDVDIYNLPARLEASYNSTWPSTRPKNNAVIITYTTGYTAPPSDIVHALKLIVGGFYNMRESECPQQGYTASIGVERLLNPYRLYYRGPWL